MTKVDFYVLSNEDPDGRLHLVCKLAEKAVQRKQRVFIHATCDATLSELDEQLWEFRADSFVAHQMIHNGRAVSSADTDPVLLSTGEPGNDHRVLINLADQVPPFFSRFERTLEVVNQAEAVRESGRTRYRFYKQRGYPLQHHKM